jgi:phospholipid transport system transporter-binding protein
MLLLPAALTEREARDTLRMLKAALQQEAAGPAELLSVDGSQLQRFDSSALAVLLECERMAQAWGKRFEVRHLPTKLVELAKVYGVDAALPIAPG